MKTLTDLANELRQARYVVTPGPHTRKLEKPISKRAAEPMRMTSHHVNRLQSLLLILPNLHQRTHRKRVALVVEGLDMLSQRVAYRPPHSSTTREVHTPSVMHINV